MLSRRDLLKTGAVAGTSLLGFSSLFGLRFRDKLRMRRMAREAGIPCPEFIGVFNPDEINEYLEKTSAPWIVKPRTEVNAFGIRKCETAEQVWQVLSDLDNRNTWRDHPSQFLIERFIEGTVFHVDSIVEGGRLVAAGVSASEAGRSWSSSVSPLSSSASSSA